MAYYPSTCTEIEAHYSCSCETELARVRGVALVHKSFYSQLIYDPEDATIWYAGITAGKIILLPETNGEYLQDEINVRGFGYSEETFMAFNHIVNYTDPDYIGNLSHYNSINGSRNYHIAFITETLVHISQRPCNIVAKMPVKNSVKEDLLFTVTVKWTHDKLPQSYLKPDGVFICATTQNVYGHSFDNSFNNSFDI